MTERIMKRSAHSGRNDDNIETLRKRFAQFAGEQVPIILRYQAEGKVKKIDALQEQNLVFEQVEKALADFI